MCSKFFVAHRSKAAASQAFKEQGFLLVELLVGLLLVSVSTLGLWVLLAYSQALTQQAEWHYKAALSGNNTLFSHAFSRDLATSTEWQSWLAENFPDSRIILKKNEEGVLVQCLPPPHSQLKIIELEASGLDLDI